MDLVFGFLFHISNVYSQNVFGWLFSIACASESPLEA